MKYIYKTNEYTFAQLRRLPDFCNVSFAEKADASVLAAFGIELAPEPEPSFEEVKEAKMREVSRTFNIAVLGSTPVSLGWRMQFAPRDCMLVEGAVKLMEATGAEFGYLTDSEEVSHAGLSLAQMKQVLLEMLGAYAAHHARKQELRAQVEAAADKAALDAVVVGFL